MWDRISFGFSGEDETVNFGTRVFNDDNIYAFEQKTLATIHRTEAPSIDEIPFSRKPISISYQNQICIAVENTLVLFNATCSDIILKVDFDCRITTFKMCNNGVFLFVALSNLEIYCVHCILRKYERILSNSELSFHITTRCENQVVSIYTYYIESKNVMSLFFIFSCGIIVRLLDVDLKILEELFNCDNTRECLENLFSNAAHSKLISALTESQNTVKSVCEFKGNLFISNGRMLLKFSPDDIPHKEENNSEIDIRRYSSECSLPTEILIQKLESTQEQLICLTADKRLIIICPYILIPLFHLPFNACADYSIVKGKSEETILIFTADKLFSLSTKGFTEKYNINLPNRCLPIYNQNEDNPSFEEILFVELCDENGAQSLRVKILEETQPISRLEKLLRKGRFEEATRFCNSFSLDIQMVYRAQASRMFEALMPWTQSKTVTVDEFIALLALIENIEFVARNCIDAITSDPRDILKLLNYGINRVKHSLNESDKDLDYLIKLYSDMGSVILKLNTYIIIYSSSASGENWITFSKADLLSEINNHLRKGEMYAAKVIWCRHWNELRRKWRKIDVIEMLNNIPDTLSIEESSDWLEEFVSIALCNNLSDLASIISWSKKKILSFDLFDRENWLEKGMTLAQLMINIFQKLEDSRGVIGLEHILIENFNNFFETLHQISRLKTVHHTNISYNDFVQEDFKEVVLFLLTKAPVDIIPNLINDFLSHILLDKKLDSDTVYSYCIERLVRQLPAGLSSPGAPWEMRAVNITRAIYNAQTRLECVLFLLKAAEIPLSECIQETVNEALKLNHPLTTAIREQLALVPSKLVLKKYSFTDVYNSEHMETIMNFIIHSEDENSFADSMIIAKTINLEDDVYIGFITKYIENGSHNKILEIMNKLEPGYRFKIQQKLNLLMNFMRDHDLERLEPYLQFFSSSMDERLSLYQKSRQLELDLQMKSSVAKMQKKNEIEELTDEACKLIIHECENKNAYHSINRASALEEIFKISHQSVLLKLASFSLHDGKGDLAVELLSYFVDSAVENMDEQLSQELLDFLGKEMPNLIKYMCNSLNPNEISSLMRTLSSMCLLRSNRANGILHAVEMSNWINLVTGCHPQVTHFSEDLHSSRLFHFLPENILSILKEYISSGNEFNNRLVKKAFKNTVINTAERQCVSHDIPDMLMSVVKSLSQIEQSTVALQVVAHLYYALTCLTEYAEEQTDQNDSAGIMFAVNEWKCVMEKENWEPLLNLCLSDILQKAILKKVPSRNFDLTNALATLNEYSEADALSWLVNQLEAHSHNAYRTKVVSILGAFYWKLKCKNVQVPFMDSLLKGQWGSKLSKLGLPYKDFVAMDKEEVVMKMITLPNISLDILRDYCLAFQYEFYDCLMKYMKHLVVSWEPDMIVTVDTIGAPVLHVRNTAEDILGKMKNVSALIEDHIEFLEVCTIVLWKMVNCYYYELYLALLDLFDHVTEQLCDKKILSQDQYASMKQYRAILNFLINYRRISRPSTHEEDMFFMDYNYMHTLPAISEFRLPFTYLVADKYNTLKSECSLSNYKLWFSVSSLLCLEKSVLCSLAIHNMHLEKLTAATNNSKEEWCIYVCNEKLLEEIRECVSYILDKEVACACLFYVVNNLPPGADQVTVASMCYEHTAKWASEDTCGQTAQTRLEKVHKKLLKVSTTHILYKYNLARREYLDLVLNPTQLICSLYQDPAILSQTDVELVHCPDINEAVEEIGRVHQENIASIKLDLLEKWLILDSNLDDSLLPESFTIKSVAKLTDDDNLARACYVMKYEEPEKTCNYLVSIAFINEMKSIEVKLRALQCLIKIITPQHIYKATGKDPIAIRQYMKSLWFVYGLEQLGLNCSMRMFESCDKSKLVGEILIQQSPASPIVAAHLCSDFDIRNTTYWNTIIKLFTESFMVDQLKEFIFRLGVDWYLLDQTVLSAAWNLLVFSPLSQVDERSEGKEAQVEKILMDLSKCPSMSLVDKESIDAQLQRLNCENLRSLYGKFC